MTACCGLLDNLSFPGQARRLGITLGTLLCRPRGLLFLGDPFLFGGLRGLIGADGFCRPFRRLGFGRATFLCLLRQPAFTFGTRAFGLDPGSSGLLGLACPCQRLLFNRLALLCGRGGVRFDLAAFVAALRQFCILLGALCRRVGGGTFGRQPGRLPGDSLLFGVPPRRQRARGLGLSRGSGLGRLRGQRFFGEPLLCGGFCRLFGAQLLSQLFCCAGVGCTALPRLFRQLGFAGGTLACGHSQFGGRRFPLARFFYRNLLALDAGGKLGCRILLGLDSYSVRFTAGSFRFARCGGRRRAGYVRLACKLPALALGFHQSGQ